MDASESVAAEPISRLGIADEQNLPPKVAAMYANLRKQRGHVPNWIQALSVHPRAMNRFTTYYADLFNSAQGQIPMTEREMIAGVVSHRNGCTYCTLHHTSGLASQLHDTQRAQRITHNFREVALTPRQRAICEFAIKVTEEPDRMSDADFDALKKQGLDKTEIFEILEIAAFFSFSNRMATPLAILPDSSLFDHQRA